MTSQQPKTSTSHSDSESNENQAYGSEVIEENNSDVDVLDVTQNTTQITSVHTSTIEVKIDRYRTKDDRMFMKVKNTPFNVHLPKFGNIKHK